MGFFARLFGKKEEKKEETVQSLPIQDVHASREYKDNLCGLCGIPIGIDKWKKMNDVFLHKKCFKQKIREVSNGFF